MCVQLESALIHFQRSVIRKLFNWIRELSISNIAGALAVLESSLIELESSLLLQSAANE